LPVLVTHGTSIDYDVHGEGPYLLLVSGLGFGRWGWFKQIPTLSRDFRTISFDIRSAQKSLTSVAELSANVVTLLEHLRIRKTHVLGTSLGGFVAQKLALERPDLVDRLVLVCTSYGIRGPQLMSPQVLGRMFGSGSLHPESAVRRGLEAATCDAYRSRHSEEFEQIVRWRLADSPSLLNFYQQAMAGARFDGSREVRKISSPTLVIHGADDCYVPVANAVALAKAIPGAKLRVLEEAAHLVFIEQAKEVNKELVSFLKPLKARKKQKPKKLSALQKRISWLEPRKRWKSKKQLAKQKRKQLVEWIQEAKKELMSSLRLLEPQRSPRAGRAPAKAKTKKTEQIYRTGKTRIGGRLRKPEESLTSGKSAVWLRAAREAASTWEKRLRAWLSLSP
jgi:3-oxoadipate enol-lactonase